MSFNFSTLANFFPHVDTHIEAIFILDGKEYEIEHFYIDVSQGIDFKGQPQHEANGGMISIVLTQAVGDNIYDWAKRANKTKEGKVLFKSKTAGTILKITFSNAHCVKLTRTINAQTGTKTNITISPEIVNMNGFIIGAACPPAGVVLGIAWFIISISGGNYVASTASYEEIHGTTCPAVSTRIIKPHIEELKIIGSKPLFTPKQYYFEQGRRKY